MESLSSIGVIHTDSMIQTSPLVTPPCYRLEIWTCIAAGVGDRDPLSAMSKTNFTAIDSVS